MLFGVFLFLLPGLYASSKTKVGSMFGKIGNAKISHRAPAQCKNHAGHVVDWWFILEESGGSKRYLYFDSQMAQISDMSGKPPRFMPLDSKFKLDDPNTSPLLKTLYSSKPYTSLKNREDNTVMIAINDQRGVEGKDLKDLQERLKKIAEKSRDPNADLIRIDKGKDIFGHPITSKNAHAKYIFTSQVVPPQKAGKVMVHSYLISHSLPRFPNFELQKDGTMRLPLIQSNVFGRNALTGTSKGQHFFCKSFENQEELDSDDELPYSPQKLSKDLKGDRHLVQIYHMFKTMNAAIIFSNYYNLIHKESMKVYRKLFDPRSEWSSKRDLSDLVTEDVRLYPIGPVDRTLKRTQCSACDLKLLCDPECISSYKIHTTDRQYLLSFNVFSHSGTAKLDLYDDVIAPQVIPKHLYSAAGDGNGVKYLVDTLIVQSWMDHSTLANNMKELIKKQDGLAVQSRVWIANSLSLRYPVHKASQVKGAEYIRQRSFGSNHAKLAFSVPLHGLGKRDALFCFADKNRTISQRGRPDQKAGRGGAAWCTKNGILAALMLTLHPEVVDNQVENNVPVYRMLHHIPDETEDESITVMEYDEENTRVELGIWSRYHESDFLCKLRHPFVSHSESRMKPVASVFALREENSSDASSESADDMECETSEDDSDADKDPLHLFTKRKRSESLKVPLRLTRQRLSYGSPAVKGTPIKFRAPIHVNQPNLTSPEHYTVGKSTLVTAAVSISDELIEKLQDRLTPSNLNAIYTQILSEPPVLTSVKRQISYSD